MKMNIPQPLRNKILFTPLLGVGCIVCGIATYLCVGDRTLLILSGVLFVMCIFKGYQYYRIAMCEKYEMICGTCIRVTPQLVGKLRKVCLMDDAGVESTLRLSKQHRFVIGNRYRIYFSKNDCQSIGNDYLDTLLSTGNFLGYEQID